MYRCSVIFNENQGYFSKTIELDHIVCFFLSTWKPTFFVPTKKGDRAPPSCSSCDASGGLGAWSVEVFPFFFHLFDVCLLLVRCFCCSLLNVVFA